MKKTFHLPFSNPDSSQRMFLQARMPSLSPLRALIPYKIRRKWRATRSRIHSRQTPTSSITSLQTSLNPADTLRSLRTHQWSYIDGQYVFVAILAIFCLCTIETPGPLFKTFVATALLMSLLIPLTRQFFLPFLPIASWLVLFYTAKFIPGEWRPPIWTRVLPTLENILYGANLSNILSAYKATPLDVLAWLPYGLAHFGAPAVVTLILFIWGPPGTAPLFARSFGYMNVTGVMTQLVFPCSPPWYENLYGLAPANYSMQGSPAGLAAIDKLLGIDLYTSSFTASPLVFGAFPSLHSANATIEALFMSHVFPSLAPVFIVYALWIWWATMYLSHHYAVDLVGGSILAGIFFFTAKTNFLPRLQKDKETRWDYDYTEIGDSQNDYSYSAAGLYEEFHPASDSDEWTIGSSSSVSSRTRSPSTGARSSGEISSWESDTLASSSDHEQPYRKTPQPH